MTTPAKCPKCGSGLLWPIRDGHANYKCHSFMTDEGGFGQDVTCVKLAEITSPLLKEVDQLRATVELVKTQRDKAIWIAQCFESRLWQCGVSVDQSIRDLESLEKKIQEMVVASETEKAICQICGCDMPFTFQEAQESGADYYTCGMCVPENANDETGQKETPVGAHESEASGVLLPAK